jgi:hypothetical protein
MTAPEKAPNFLVIKDKNRLQSLDTTVLIKETKEKINGDNDK